MNFFLFFLIFFLKKTEDKGNYYVITHVVQEVNSKGEQKQATQNVMGII